MCATVFYTKLIKGKLYPKAARTGPYAFANEVSRVRGKVVSKYIGIVRVPEGTAVTKEEGEVDADLTSLICAVDVREPRKRNPLTDSASTEAIPVPEQLFRLSSPSISYSDPAWSIHA